MRLTICSIIWNDIDMLPILIDGQKDIADEFVIVSSPNCTDGTWEKLEEYSKNPEYNLNLIASGFVEPDKYDFGKARQLAHDNAKSDWVMWLDADECIGDDSKKIFKGILDDFDAQGVEVAHVQYIHFYNDFAHIDNSEGVHIGLTRLYKKIPGITFDAKNHALPKGNFKKLTAVLGIVIFHLGYTRGLMKIKERFARNFYESTIHFPFHQVVWRDWHYFGDYPTKPFRKEHIPKIIRDVYLMEVE